MRQTIRFTAAMFSLAMIADCFAADCSALADDKDRLACYDAAARAKPTELPKSAEGRASYAASLQRFLLSRGFDIETGARERPAKSAQGRSYPELLIFGPLDNPLIYRLITQTKVLEAAKTVGFNLVEFQSNLGDGHWWWDISGAALPQCDRVKRLCL